MDWKDWEEAWKQTSEESSQEEDAHEKALVFALADVLLAQVQRSPVNRTQAIAALDIAKTVLKL